MAQIMEFFLNLLLIRGKFLTTKAADALHQAIKRCLEYKRKFTMDYSKETQTIVPFNMLDFINQRSSEYKCEGDNVVCINEVPPELPEEQKTQLNQMSSPPKEEQIQEFKTATKHVKKMELPKHHRLQIPEMRLQEKVSKGNSKKKDGLVENFHAILKSQEFLFKNVMKLIDILETNDQLSSSKHLEKIKQQLLACTDILSNNNQSRHFSNINDLVEEEITRCRFRSGENKTSAEIDLKTSKPEGMEIALEAKKSNVIHHNIRRERFNRNRVEVEVKTNLYNYLRRSESDPTVSITTTNKKKMATQRDVEEFLKQTRADIENSMKFMEVSEQHFKRFEDELWHSRITTKYLSLREEYLNLCRCAFYNKRQFIATESAIARRIKEEVEAETFQKLVEMSQSMFKIVEGKILVESLKKDGVSQGSFLKVEDTPKNKVEKILKMKEETTSKSVTEGERGPTDFIPQFAQVYEENLTNAVAPAPLKTPKLHSLPGGAPSAENAPGVGDSSIATPTPKTQQTPAGTLSSVLVQLRNEVKRRELKPVGTSETQKVDVAQADKLGTIILTPTTPLFPNKEEKPKNEVKEISPVEPRKSDFVQTTQTVKTPNVLEKTKQVVPFQIENSYKVTNNHIQIKKAMTDPIARRTRKQEKNSTLRGVLSESNLIRKLKESSQRKKEAQQKHKVVEINKEKKAPTARTVDQEKTKSKNDEIPLQGVASTCLKKPEKTSVDPPKLSNYVPDSSPCARNTWRNVLENISSENNVVSVNIMSNLPDTKNETTETPEKRAMAQILKKHNATKVNPSDGGENREEKNTKLLVNITSTGKLMALPEVATTPTDRSVSNQELQTSADVMKVNEKAFEELETTIRTVQIFVEKTPNCPKNVGTTTESKKRKIDEPVKKSMSTNHLRGKTPKQDTADGKPDRYRLYKEIKQATKNSLTNGKTFLKNSNQKPLSSQEIASHKGTHSMAELLELEEGSKSNSQMRRTTKNAMKRQQVVTILPKVSKKIDEKKKSLVTLVETEEMKTARRKSKLKIAKTVSTVSSVCKATKETSLDSVAKNSTPRRAICNSCKQIIQSKPVGKIHCVKWEENDSAEIVKKLKS